MIPWKRCLQNVTNGTMDVALSASGNMERKTTYRMSDAYYQVTPSYIYLKTRFPDGLQVTAEQASEQYKICGLRGYSYDSFGLPTAQVETTSNTFRQLFNKTAAGRCDLFLARFEILVGFELIGNPLLTSQWGHSPVPDIPPDSFHMLVSRNIPDSEDIQNILNKGILELGQSGQLDQILIRYFR